MHPRDRIARTAMLAVLVVGPAGVGRAGDAPAPGPAAAAVADPSWSNDGLELTTRRVDPTPGPPGSLWVEVVVRNRGPRRAWLGPMTDGDSRYDLAVARRAASGDPAGPAVAVAGMGPTYDGPSLENWLEPGGTTARRFRLDERFAPARGGGCAVRATFRAPTSMRTAAQSMRELAEIRAGRLALPADRPIRAEELAIAR